MNIMDGIIITQSKIIAVLVFVFNLSVIIELSFLKGANNLDIPVFSEVQY